MLCGFLPQPPSGDIPEGNVLPWRHWEKGARLVGLDPRHMHTGQKALTRRVASKVEQRVLDVGCGVGGLLSMLPESIEAVGVDVSSYCVHRARSRLEPHENTRVINADILDINEEKLGRFSTIVGLDVIHMLDRVRVLKKFSNLLKKKGQFIFTDCLSDNNHSELFTPFKAKPPLSKKEYEKVTNDSSFDIVSVDDFTEECIHETRSVLSKFRREKPKKWIIDKWGEEYYQYTIHLSHEWDKMMSSGKIKYALLTVSKSNCTRI